MLLGQFNAGANEVYGKASAYYIEDFGHRRFRNALQDQPTMTDMIDRIVSGLTVQESDAKQDRIHLKLKRWTFQGNMLQFERFSTRLSQTFDAEGNGIQRRLFNARQGTERYAIWPITGGTGSRRYLTPPGLPLFAGKLRGYQQPSGADQSIKTWQLVAELFINPTRAMRYERDAYAVLRLENRNELLQVPPPLFARAKQTPNGHAFISGDNFEEGSRLERGLFRQPLWGVNVERYWRGIVRLIDEALKAASEEANGAVYYPVDEKLTLKTIETYWDFSDRDPVAAVAALEHPFRAQGTKSSVEWYTIPQDALSNMQSRGIIIAGDDNSPVIKLHAAKGVQIKAYAKTTSTVRLEVTHSHIAAAIGRFTASDHDGLFDWIARTSDDATLYLNRFLTAVRPTLLPPLGYQHPPQRLFYDLYEAYKDWPKAISRLSILIRDGKIEAKKSSPLAPEVKLLIRKKIIHRVSARNADVRIFHVTERYRGALEALRGVV